MAGLGTVTPRAKRPRRGSRGHLGQDLRLSVTKAAARQRAQSRQREGDQVGHCQPQGWDPWDPVPCPFLASTTPRRSRRAQSRQREGDQVGHCQPQGWDPRDPVPCPSLAPTTPGRGGRAKLRGEGNRRRLASAVPCSGERDPASRRLQPRYGGTYFSGLPAVECQDPAAPSLLLPAAPAASSTVPRRTRSAPEWTLVLELEGILVCSSVLPSWRQGAAATFTTEFQGEPYEIFIFTTATQDYTEKVLEVLVPKGKLIRHCLCRQDCLCAQGCYWKDLSRLGRDLDKLVALDHTIQGIPAQAANWVPVPRWCGEPQDEELLQLIPRLAQLSREELSHARSRRQLLRRRLPPED
ncbi:uncharacterized protein LOC135192282 isoform X2 [Pogoniulus pusillus]|uniref:uncharacterized protein LOC135192282 isoform X2 n=1 Tax=Pogoniulus pusillus TaxID=488313 RepID=UPI0030B989FF